MMPIIPSSTPAGSRRQSDARFASVFHEAGIGIELSDSNRRPIEINPALQKMLGYSALELAQLTLLQITHPDDADLDADLFNQLLCGQVKRYQIEKRYIRKDGSVMWGRLTSSVIDSDGQLLVLGIVEDISGHKEVEQTLRFQKALLEAQAEASLDGVLVVSPESKIISYNKRFAQMWGIPQDILASGSDAAALVYVKDKLENLDDFLARVAYLYQHPDQSGYYEARLKNGRIFRCYGMPLRASDGVHLGRMFHFHDASDDLHAEQVNQECHGLRGAVQALDQVLGVVGHELRTPLAAVRMMSEFLIGNPAEQEQCETFLKSVHREVVRMSSMVDDLLEVARLNSGTAHWNWSRFLVAQPCQEAMDSVRPLIDPRRVELSLSVEPEKLEMSGDTDAVCRLVLNLVNNAAKHTHAGMIHIRARALSIADCDYVEIEVTDTGEGMPRDIAARLGQAFALNSGVIGTNHVRGSGLGLAICRGIVAAHGGTITVASELGAGTTVTVLLRADLPQAAQPANETSLLRTATR
jgi:PAS domain S-box-containing protein